MSKKEITEEVIEIVEDTEVVEPAVESNKDKKNALKALIAQYKEQSPEKYEAKKEELEAKLKAL